MRQLSISYIDPTVSYLIKTFLTVGGIVYKRKAAFRSDL